MTPPSHARRAIALVVLCVLAGSCGGGGGAKAKARTPPTTAINSTVALRLIATNLSSTGPNVAFPASLRDALSKSVNQYVESAVVAPLRSGAVAPDLAPIFTAAAAAKLNGADRSTLTEEGVPPLTGSIMPTTAAFALTGLADNAGHVVLVSAALDLDLHAPVAGGDLHIVRTGDLLFADDGDTWRVAGYDMSVQRQGPGVQVAAGRARREPSA